MGLWTDSCCHAALPRELRGSWPAGPWNLPTAPIASGRGAHSQHERALVLKELGEVSQVPHFPGLLVFVNSRGFLYSLHRLCVFTAWSRPGLTGIPAHYSAPSSPALLIIAALVTCKVGSKPVDTFLFCFLSFWTLVWEDFSVQSQKGGVGWSLTS